MSTERPNRAHRSGPLLPDGDDFHLIDPTNGTGGATADPVPEDVDPATVYGRRVGGLSIGGLGGF